MCPSLAEGCVASHIFSTPPTPPPHCSEQQSALHTNVSTLQIKHLNFITQLQPVCGCCWISGCMSVCAVFSAGCTTAPGGSLVSIQVEFYEYLVTRWDPNRPHIHPPKHTERMPPATLCQPQDPPQCSDQSQVDAAVGIHMRSGYLNYDNLIWANPTTYHK